VEGTMINIYYRPVIITNGKQRALKDRDNEKISKNALIEALKTEKAGAEGYILTVFKREDSK
jgi:hypothetical protein